MKTPKGEFKRLTYGVIDFDKRTTILFNQRLVSKPFNSRWVGSNLMDLVLVLLFLMNNFLDQKKHYWFNTQQCFLVAKVGKRLTRDTLQYFNINQVNNRCFDFSHAGTSNE